MLVLILCVHNVNAHTFKLGFDKFPEERSSITASNNLPLQVLIEVVACILYSQINMLSYLLEIVVDLGERKACIKQESFKA